MNYIREVLALLFLAFMLILEVPFHFVTWLIGLSSPQKCLEARYRYVQFVLRGIWFFAGGKIKVIGAERIPKDRAVLFVGTHRSIFDIVIAAVNIPMPTGFIAKKELENTPLKLAMDGIRCLFLDRQDPRKGLKTILTAIEYIKEGQSMLIFPEGTRSKKEEELLPFHAGSFKIATKAECPVVPFTIVGSGDLFEDHFPVLKCKDVVIEFGEPIETAGMDRAAQRELPERVKEIIAQTYEKDAALL